MTARYGELFPDEIHPANSVTPGTIGNDEELERHVPDTADVDEVSKAHFTRDELMWTHLDGGASVNRTGLIRNTVGGRRGMRGTIKARVGDIREQVDDHGNRKWHVVPSPRGDDASHAEIYRDPQGKRPTRLERRDFVALWSSVVEELRRCKLQIPDGQVTVSAKGAGGVRLLWKAESGETRPVGQVRTISDVMKALIKAGVISESDSDAERDRLESEWANSLKDIISRTLVC